MRKSDLVAAVMAKARLSEREADDAVASMLEHVTNALARGESVNLIGFGAFNVRTRESRLGRNPQSGVEMLIPASQHVGFRAGKSLRSQVASAPEPPADV